MKKSGKILIAILFLIIVGLVTFIVVDKVISKNGKNSQSGTEEFANNTINNENAQNNDNAASMDGTYKRTDDSERTSGTLNITKYSDNGFEFQIDATKVIGSDTQKSIENGSVNMGGTSGVAKKVSDNVFEFVPEKDDVLIESFDGEYKIRFIVNSKSIKIEEIYDKTKHSQGPYSGGQVQFDGVYELVNNEIKQKGTLSEANEAIRKALKSPDFFKKYNFPIDDNHEVTFIKLKNYENRPVYFIQSFAEENVSVSLMSITYDDGIVLGEVYIDESFMTSIWVDPNNYILKTVNSRFGEDTFTFEKIQEVKFQLLDQLIGPMDENIEENPKYYKYDNGTEKRAEITKQEYESVLNKYDDKFKLVTIDTELTNENIDEYVK